MHLPLQQRLFATVVVRGREFFWTAKDGLDSAVVETVEGWIWSRARKLAYPAAKEGLALEDLVQAGRMGAFEAARRFDPRHDSNFLTYADRWIRRRMLESLNQGQVTIPGDTREELRKGGQLPDVVSLDLELPSGEGTLGDHLPARPDGVLERALARRQVRELLTLLPERERIVLARAYGLGGDAESLGAIGTALGLSMEGVREIRNAALRRLKKHIHGKRHAL